jgi:DNA-binding SARP family transcriptional activator
MESGDISGRVSSLIDESRSFESTGNIGEAFQRANEALSLACEEGSPAGNAAALLGLAFLHFRIGHDAEVIRLASQALELAPPQSRWRVDALMMLGAAGEGEDYMLRRKERYLAVIDLARQINYPRALVRALHNLAAGVYMPWGQFELALAADREALKLAKSKRIDDLVWGPLHTIGWILWQTRRFAAAREITRELAEVSQPDSMGEGYVTLIHANIQVQEGEFDQARTAYERARSIGEKNGSPEVGIFVRLGLSRLERAQGNAPAARAWAEDALELTRRVEYPHQEGNALVECGRAAWCNQDRQGAEDYLRQALAKLVPLRAAFELARGSLYLAALLSAEDYPEAPAAWVNAARLIHDNGYDFLLEEERALVIPFIARYLDAPDPLLAQTSAALYAHLERVPPAPLQVLALGQFSLRIGARAAAKESLRQRRCGELLALLLSSPGYTLSFSQVAELMCPEKEPQAALDFYHHAISALRRLLEPDLPDRRFICRYLEVNDERVTLILPEGSRVDFFEFRQHLQNREWEKAATLYRGDFLPSFLYSDWTLLQRQHLADLHEQVLLELAAERFAHGDPAACLDLVRRVLLHNAWQEQAVGLGMRAAVQLGNRSTALRMYQRLESVLAKDLGIAPQEDLQQLYKSLKLG